MSESTLPSVPSALICRWGVEDRTVRKAFLALPAALYPPDRLPQKKSAERAILSGRHPLSGEFEIIPIVTLNEREAPLCRCLLTLYPGEDVGYVGFFESVGDPESARMTLNQAERLAARHGRTRLIGPLNASFWIGYRMKISRFDRTYTLEPYNREGYLSLWESAGYAVTDRYYSTLMRIPQREDSSMKCRQRLELIEKRGCTITAPTKRTFSRNLEEIYDLMIRVYAHFPTFRPISRDKFCHMFASLRHVLDFDMVKLAYREGRLVGFCVCVPDYGGLLHRDVGLVDLPKIRRIRRNPPGFVLLYTGIDPKEAGLGSALAECVKQELVKRKLPSVSALIHEGTVTGAYYRELAEGRIDYVLLEKRIDRL